MLGCKDVQVKSLDHGMSGNRLAAVADKPCFIVKNVDLAIPPWLRQPLKTNALVADLTSEQMTPRSCRREKGTCESSQL